MKNNFENISGTPSRLTSIKNHKFIRVMIEIESPILALFQENSSLWFYLWCDTDNEGTQRWLIFNVHQKTYTDFIRSKISLRDVLSNSEITYCLDANINLTDGGKKLKLKEVIHRNIETYFPSRLSFFDPTYLPPNRNYFDLYT